MEVGFSPPICSSSSGPKTGYAYSRRSLQIGCHQCFPLRVEFNLGLSKSTVRRLP